MGRSSYLAGRPLAEETLRVQFRRLGQGCRFRAAGVHRQHFRLRSVRLTSAQTMGPLGTSSRPL